MQRSSSAGRLEASARRTRRLSRVVGALLVAGMRMAMAEPGPSTDEASLHLSGFGTIGLARTVAGDGVGFQRESVQRGNDGGTRADIDTRLGVQAYYRASWRFEMVGEMLAANRNPNAPDSDVLTLAFAAWRPTDDITVRAGRLGTDFYLLADYRNVGFAYPFVRPPVENYAPTPYSFDGVDVTKAWLSDESTWKLRGILGQSAVTSNHSAAPVRTWPNYVLVLTRDDGDGLLLRGSLARVRLHTDLSAARPLLDALAGVASLPDAGVAAQARDLASVFDVNGHTVHFLSVGASYDRGAWIGNLEASRFQPLGSGGAYTNGWALVGHRWGALTAYAGVSAIRTSHSRSLPQWSAALTPSIGAAAAAEAQQIGTAATLASAAAAANQRTFTLGIRWDLADRLALKLQWDRVRVDAFANRLWSTPSPGAPIDAHIGSATLDFVF